MLVYLAACDIPTALPNWDTTFVIQGEATTLAVGQILPSSIALTSNGTAFSLSLSPSTFARNLGSLCTACVALHGTNAPKPAFSHAFGTTITLPADVQSAALSSGTVTVNVTHGFAFDPLRPGASARGSMTITIRSGAATIVGLARVDGRETAFAPGSVVSVAVPLTAGTIANQLSVEVIVDSPAGSTAVINTNAQMTTSATPSAITVSSAQVTVSNRQITAAPFELDLKNIDDFIIDRVQGGALLLTVDNPFAVAGTLTMTLSGGARIITKPLRVVPGQSVTDVAFDASELQALLGRAIHVGITGPVSSAANVAVMPTQVVSVNTKLKLIIGVEK